MVFELICPTIESGGWIPKRYTCDGDDVSIPLAWTGVPPGSLSFALIADDPDAPRGTWVHWVLYDLSTEARGVPEAVSPVATLPDGGKQGMNDFGRVGYGGPCPPPGAPHRYVFTLFALSRPTGLPARSTKSHILDAVTSLTVGQAQWIGRYRR